MQALYDELGCLGTLLTRQPSVNAVEERKSTHLLSGQGQTLAWHSSVGKRA